MKIDKIMELLPDTVKCDIIDFTPVKLKDGRRAERITLDRLLTPAEKSTMHHTHILGVDCVACHRYAPEIKHSYFYIV